MTNEQFNMDFNSLMKEAILYLKGIVDQAIMGFGWIA